MEHLSTQPFTLTELSFIAVIALYLLKEFVAPMVKRAFVQNAEARETAFKELKTQVANHDQQLVDLKYERKSLDTELGNISGKLEALDRRIAEQGKSHDQKLGDALQVLSREFNNKLASTLNTELERTVRAVVREELQTRGPSRPV